MRALFFVSLSAVVVSACSTTQENPIYQQSSTYQNGSPAPQQYASVPAADTTAYTQKAYSQTTYAQDTYSTDVTHANHVASTPTYPVFAHPSPVLGTSAAIIAESPTDSAYGSEYVTGTPGYMAMQGQTAPMTSSEAEPLSSTVQTASSTGYNSPEYSASDFGATSVYGAAGTPIAYDYSRNLVTADALTTGQQPDETVRILQGTGQNYVVQPGDTVYSLSRRTCVGVSVIQSMNGIGADYGIKIGQALTLPSPVC